MSLKQVRCWSEAEYSVRDQLISTHRTPIRHTHTHMHTHRVLHFHCRSAWPNSERKQSVSL